MRTGMTGRLRHLATLKLRRDRAQQPCGTCKRPVGAARVKTHPAAFCSARCYAKSPQAVEGHKARKRARKARAKANWVESVNVLRVFERDGWLCHLCNELTIKSRRGTTHPLAPVLEHIIPLAKGGSHSYANTACAHHHCNAEKSDKIVGRRAIVAWAAMTGVGQWMTHHTQNIQPHLAA